MEYQSIADFENGNVALHPFVIDLGKHSSMIGDNVLNNKIQLYAFKTSMSSWLEDFCAEHKRATFSKFIDNHVQYLNERRLFQNAGIQLDTKKNSVIDRAVELGLQLDFEAMQESFKKTIEYAYNRKAGEHVPFFENMNSLEQICQLKVLEGRVLYIFREDIERENLCGSISILSAIENTANAIYMIGQSPSAYKGKKTLRKELTVFEKKLNSYSKITEREKEAIISDFCNLAMVVYENTVLNMYDAGVENVDEYCEIMNTNLSSLIENNYNIVEAINNSTKSSDNNVCNIAIDEEDEETPYVSNPDFKDPSVL